jgi:hypothetical protein
VIALTLNSTQAGCQMRLWYWLSNPNYGFLNILKREAVGASWLLVKSIKEATNTWTRVDIDIPESNIPFQVLIEGGLLNNRKGFLVTDDISFSPQCIIQDDAAIPTRATREVETSTLTETTSEPIKEKENKPTRKIG